MVPEHSGLRPPFSRHQYLAWSVFTISVLVLYALCIPVLSEDLQLRVAVSHALILVFSSYVFYTISCHHPGRPKFPDSPSAEDEANSLWCSRCQHKIPLNSKTRHCSVCKQCVSGFDHHCVYLNQCVGRDNYRLFILMCICLILLISISVRTFPHLRVLFV